MTQFWRIQKNTEESQKKKFLLNFERKPQFISINSLNVNELRHFIIIYLLPNLERRF